MRPVIAAVMLCASTSIAMSPAAKADFIMLPPPHQATAASDRATRPDSREVATKRAIRGPHFAVTRGFGNQVPLSFAVRQIVPRAVKVHFAKGVDPATAVDWNGGRPWNAVLWSAVHPLGLHLVLKPGAVWIFN
jgi:hypothetical protein